MEYVKASIAARVASLKDRRAWLILLMGLIVAAAAVLIVLGSANRAPAPAPQAVAYIVPERTDPLTPQDRVLYQSIYLAQADGEFDRADSMIPRLSSKLLLGHVLAQRYLFTDYVSSAAELESWVANFPDHPQADKIRSLAGRKGVRLPPATVYEASLRGAGYIDHLGARALPQGWYHGLSLWRNQQYDKAAEAFEKVASMESLNEWHRSAAYFWAYRSYDKLKDSSARDMLEMAAEYPTTFYGMLAGTKLRSNANRWMASAPFVPSSLRRNPAVLRAQALASIGRENDAEDELRNLFSDLSRYERKALVTLASEFNLPNLQVRLSKMKELTNEEALFASYPMPKSIAAVQSTIDPALIFAISRQESGFRPHVSSHAGAVGMMQVMPATANHIMRRLGTQLASIDSSAIRLTDADTNVRLGAAYIEILMKEPSVNHSLIHALASYNAGPGAVASWARAARNIDDPLLYIESIPYKETRNYVVQVMAHYWVYRHLMGEPTATLQSLAEGKWPHYKLG